MKRAFLFKNAILLAAGLIYSAASFAGTSPMACHDASGNKVLRLQMVSGPLLISGTLLPNIGFEEIHEIQSGLIVAKAGDLKVVFLGNLTRATLLSADGEIVAELVCKREVRHEEVKPD